MYKLSLLFSGLCLLGIAACQNPRETATTGKPEPAPPAIQPRIDSLMQQLAIRDKMYAGVAASRNGELVHNQAYGYAAIKGGDTLAADHTTPYRIGSITKTFTATLFMQLVEKDQISLSTKLSAFYPDMPNADSITMEHLLRHQSGLHNYTRDSIFGQSENLMRTKQEMLAHFRDTEPEFQPGEQFQYSNTNYVLLGYILEDITGKRYPELLQQRIVQPLGLARTYFSDSTLREGEARSFKWTGRTWKRQGLTHPSVTHGAGGIVSTPSDLVAFYRGLFEGQLVDTQSLNRMTSMKEGISQKNRYGLGLLQMPFRQKSGYGHTGGVDGYAAQAGYFPKDSVAFAITANALNYSRNQAAIGLLSMVFDRDYQIPEFNRQTVSLSADRLARMAGKYSSEKAPIDLTLRADSNILKAQGTGQPEFPLTPVADTAFEYKRVGVEIRFKQPEADTFRQFYLLQAGGKYLFERME